MIEWKVDRTQLDEDFANDVDALFAADEAQWIIHYGRRSRGEQESLYRKFQAGGPLAAPPGRSAHEYGLAVDFHELTDGKDDWTVGPNWRRIMDKVDHHPRLHGGWHFPVPDNDHIQSVRWYALRRDLKDRGAW